MTQNRTAASCSPFSPRPRCASADPAARPGSADGLPGRSEEEQRSCAGRAGRPGLPSPSPPLPTRRRACEVKANGKKESGEDRDASLASQLQSPPPFVPRRGTAASSLGGCRLSPPEDQRVPLGPSVQTTHTARSELAGMQSNHRSPRRAEMRAVSARGTGAMPGELGAVPAFCAEVVPREVNSRSYRPALAACPSSGTAAQRKPPDVPPGMSGVPLCRGGAPTQQPGWISKA